jgi:hypothetical protein
MRVANVMGVVGFVVYGVLAAIMLPIFLVVAFVAKATPDGPPPWLFVVMLIVYPILGAIFGWIFGGLSALVYNLVTRWTGGIEFSAREVGKPASFGAAPTP